MLGDPCQTESPCPTRKRSLVQIQYGPRHFSKSCLALIARRGGRLLRFCRIVAGQSTSRCSPYRRLSPAWRAQQRPIELPRQSIRHGLCHGRRMPARPTVPPVDWARRPSSLGLGQVGWEARRTRGSVSGCLSSGGISSCSSVRRPSEPGWLAAPARARPTSRPAATILDHPLRRRPRRARAATRAGSRVRNSARKWCTGHETGPRWRLPSMVKDRYRWPRRCWPRQSGPARGSRCSPSGPGSSNTRRLRSGS